MGALVIGGWGWPNESHEHFAVRGNVYFFAFRLDMVDAVALGAVFFLPGVAFEDCAGNKVTFVNKQPHVPCFGHFVVRDC